MNRVMITFNDGHIETVRTCKDFATAVGRKAASGYKDEDHNPLTYEEAWLHLGGRIEYTNTLSGFPEYYDEIGNFVH